MKLVVLDTKNTVKEQLVKINSELMECYTEHDYWTSFSTLGRYDIGAIKRNNTQLEALDLLTAALNLVNMLNIPKEVQEEHYQKMLGYQTDPSRMYEIVGVVEVREVER